MITGTFLDDISPDLPSLNFGPEEWTREFAAMKADGIDTVVLSRAGYRDRAVFDSKVLRTLHLYLIVQDDMLALYLSLAGQNGMNFWVATYESGEHWENGQYQKEFDQNRRLADEMWERYGRSRAFRGWFVAQDVDTRNEAAMRAFESYSNHVRQLSALPILLAPHLSCGSSLHPNYERETDDVFARLAGLAQVLSFEDGDVSLADLPAWVSTNARLAKKHGFTTWSNLESFDRDVPTKFPPIAWPKLRYKMESALSASVDKLITFEYSHFLSQHSLHNSAHALHKRYREWLATQK